MKLKAYISAHTVLTPLGLGAETNWQKMAAGACAIQATSKEDIVLKEFFASSISKELLEEVSHSFEQTDLTVLEKMMVASVQSIAPNCPLPLKDNDTIFVIATTKGNIDQFPLGTRPRLSEMAKKISRFFHNTHDPIVVSTACTSGVSALLVGKNLLENGLYKQVVVCGGDILSEFTVSGFNSLHALSPVPCRPFDKGRMGLSPGEGCGVAVLSSVQHGSGIYISGGGTSNDANHISGPSRTGEGLHLAIERTLKSAALSRDKIDYVNSHGTATLYNDESEGRALTLSQLNNVLTNSFKGYLGHTFGAAGLIEIALCLESMERSTILPSHGFSELGVSSPVTIAQKKEEKNITHCLKTASGFGGCNAALILSKNE